MDLSGHWYTFSLEAEIEAHGTYRIVGEHNRLREENAWLREALRAISMLDHHDHSNSSEAGELARAALRRGVEP